MKAYLIKTELLEIDDQTLYIGDLRTCIIEKANGSYQKYPLRATFSTTACGQHSCVGEWSEGEINKHNSSE